MAASDPIELAAEIISAFVSNNSMPMGELPALIEAVHAAVTRLAEPGEVAAAVVNAPAQAVSVRKSVTPDYLICLDDGKRFKSLRRHLGVLDMTPDEYRAKWGLPGDYPMVAPNYTAQRSAMAKNMGLGQSRKKPVAAVAASAAIEVVAPDSVSVETIKLATVEPEPEPASVTTKVVAAPPPVSAKRKLGRPRKVTA